MPIKHLDRTDVVIERTSLQCMSFHRVEYRFVRVMARNQMGTGLKLMLPTARTGGHFLTSGVVIR